MADDDGIDYAREPGKYMKKPIFYKSKTFVRKYEDSACCQRIGRCAAGLGRWADADASDETGDPADAPFSRRRFRIMAFAAGVSLVAAVLQIYALFALTANDAVVRHTAWWTGTVDGASPVTDGTAGVTALESFESTVYMGLRIVTADYTYKALLANETVSSGAGTVSFAWKDEACGTHVVSDACATCESASVGIWTSVVVSALTSLTQLQTDLLRSTRRGDLNCQKGMGIGTGIFGFASTLAALLAFVTNCSDRLPTPDATFTFAKAGGSVTLPVTWSVGPAFACLLVATLLKPVDVACHAILPTPPRNHPKYPFEDGDVEGGGGANGTTAAPTAAPTTAAANGGGGGGGVRGEEGAVAKI